MKQSLNDERASHLFRPKRQNTPIFHGYDEKVLDWVLILGGKTNNEIM